jgi:hypothetical protein
MLVSDHENVCSQRGPYLVLGTSLHARYDLHMRDDLGSIVEKTVLFAKRVKPLAHGGTGLERVENGPVVEVCVAKNPVDPPDNCWEKLGPGHGGADQSMPGQCQLVDGQPPTHPAPNQTAPAIHKY